MNPMAPPAAPPTAGASTFSPSSSPLHPPSVTHNTRVLSSLSTVSSPSLRFYDTALQQPPTTLQHTNNPPKLAACFSGLVAGILGLTNFPGFLLYLTTSILSALTVFTIKCKGDVGRYVPQSHVGLGGGGVKLWKGWLGLLGVGQENLLGFLLFWIGSYALIHVYD